MRFPQKPPSIDKIIESHSDSLLWLSTGRPALPDGRYLPWNDLRYRPPPEGQSSQQWWASTKFARLSASVPISTMVKHYKLAFSHVPLPAVQRALHNLDRANIQGEIIKALGNEDAKVEYRARQLIEEAISSSQVEGANPTTREVARQLVRENRKPASIDERMILNNWQAMKRMLEIHDEKRDLTREDLLDMHCILGKDALEVEDGEGKFRTVDDAVEVSTKDDVIWHIPPDATGLESRIQALLAFINKTAADDDADGHEPFIHPILRAIIAHFWLAYEHPFRDGNGRMARALFYWCMLKQGYEAASFLSISGPIDRDKKGYSLAFVHTEIDDGDLTYFILHQLEVIQEAIDELHAHLKRRAERIVKLSRAVAQFDELNHRQRSVLLHSIRHPLQGQTIEALSRVHSVHYMTARQDLADLEKRGLFVGRNQKPKRYFPAPDIQSVLPSPNKNP